ncbi:hypothetical protein Trydic_g15489 [Trypoxylus dichotomus]
MKLILILLGLSALVYADNAPVLEDIDWSTVKTRNIVINPNGGYKIHSRIVGGRQATPHQFPYQGGLFIVTPAQNYFCGCVLISPNYVLTAAHCLDNAIQVQVRLGAHYINANEISQQRFVSTQFSQHPGWNPNTLSHDFAVVRLPNPAVLNDKARCCLLIIVHVKKYIKYDAEYVSIIALPTWADTDITFDGEIATLFGWGVTVGTSTTMSETLYYTNAAILMNIACEIFFGQILPSQICTSGSGGVGACTGDSGGAVVANNRLVGIISFALSLSCEGGWPSGHARVTTVLDWLYYVTDANIVP